ncbi:MAG: ParB/RepB/Spo0J family partition protein [Bacteroidales bacterium]|jgi:ParB family chromosome partitioning protein|nr:ParB/RepB/Spo0J family partition protein [Bacteroidales bacterium]
MAKRNAIGLGPKGIGALIPQARAETVNTTNMIDMAIIENNPYNPRTNFNREELEELAASIRQLGVITPITVRKTGNGKYQIIAGERRYRASQLAGLNEIPAYVRETDDENMLLLALIENTHRKDLNAIEVAISYQRMMDEHQLTQEEISNKVGKQRSTVTNYLRLLKLPPEVQLAVKEDKVSMGHVRPLINIDQTDIQLRLLHEIINEDLSVRETEKRSRLYTQPESTPVETAATSKTAPEEKVVYNDPVESPEIPESDLEPYVTERLSNLFSTKVNVKRGTAGSGRIIIHFRTDEEFRYIRQMTEKISVHE